MIGILIKPLFAGLITAVLFAPGPPPWAWVNDFVGQPQQYNLSCEIRSATDVANFWEVPVSEDTLIAMLPRSDDPNLGFLGDMNAPAGSLPPVGYGVYANPVAYLLRRAGLKAEPHRDFDLEKVKEELSQGHPVIIWGTYGMQLVEIQQWTTQLGRTVPVAQWEHTFVAVGYDETGIQLVDAYDATSQYYDYETFLNGWNMLGRMAVTVSGYQKPDTAITIQEKDGVLQFFWREETFLGPW